MECGKEGKRRGRQAYEIQLRTLLFVSLMASMVATIHAISSDVASGNAHSAAPGGSTLGTSGLCAAIVAALRPAASERRYLGAVCWALPRLLGPHTWLSGRGAEAGRLLRCLHHAQGAGAVRLAPQPADRVHLVLAGEGAARQAVRATGSPHYLLLALTHRVGPFSLQSLVSAVNATIPVAVISNVSDTPGVFCSTQDGVLKDITDPFFTSSRPLPALMEDLWLTCHGKPIIRVVLLEIKPIIYWHKRSDGVRQLVGPELQLLEAALERLASRVELHVARNVILGAPLADRKGFVGAVAELWEGEADVLGNMVYPWTWRGHFDATYPLRPSDYLLVVAKAGEYPRALCLLLPFSGCVWLACGAALVALSVTWGLLTTGGAPASWTTAFFQVYSTLLTGSPCGTRDRRASARTLAALVLLFGVVATNSYQGSLASLFASPRQQADADTLEAVDRAARAVFAFPPFSSVLRQAAGGDVMRRLAAKLVARHDRWPGAFDQVAAGGGWAAVSGQAFADYYVRHPRYRDASGRPLLHVSRQPALSPAYCGYVCRRGWPLTSRLSLAASRLQAAGVWQKLQQEQHHRARLGREADSAVAGGDVTAVLRPAHLAASFALLAAGLAAGAVAFLLELRLRAAVRPSDSVPVAFLP